MDPAILFRKNLKAFFERYKLRGGNQTKLAKEVGVGQSNVSVWLSGGYLPSAENLPSLAKALGVSIQNFYEEEPAIAEALGAQVPEIPSDPWLARMARLTEEQRKLLEPSILSVENSPSENEALPQHAKKHKD